MRRLVLLITFLSIFSLKGGVISKMKVIDTNSDIPGGSRAPANNQDNSSDGDNDMNRRRKQKVDKPTEEDEG